MPITFALNWCAFLCVNPIPPAYLDPKEMLYGKCCRFVGAQHFNTFGESISFQFRCNSRCIN
eukprot:13516151-Ditylum_brightwellii.AAC.1